MEAGIQAQGCVHRLPSLALDSATAPWIPATSMDGGSAEEDMESSPPIPTGMTVIRLVQIHITNGMYHQATFTS